MGTMVKMKTDGTQEIVEAKSVSYDDLSKFVGGPLERVKVRHNGKLVYMWVNEEGHPLRLPINIRATELYQHTYPTQHSIVGNVVVLNGVRFK